MAGDVVIHRAYFGEAENLETLHARLYRIECSLRDLQERDKPVVDAEVADPWKGGPVTVWHEEVVADFIDWAAMAGDKPLPVAAVVSWLKSRGPAFPI